jgi:hypothetical protein
MTKTVSLVKLEINLDKEVYTVKVGSSYRGVIIGSNALYLTNEDFDSPLKAANAARKLKRENKITKTIKKNSNPSYPTIQTKITKVEKFYSEAEVAAFTHLRFREAWVILSPKGKYVKNMLQSKSLVDYCDDETKALVFNTYEDASINQKTLNITVCNGHFLRRFFVETK